MNVQAENWSVKSIYSGYRLENDMGLNTMIYQPSQSQVGWGFMVSSQDWGFLPGSGFGFRVIFQSWGSLQGLVLFWF